MKNNRHYLLIIGLLGVAFLSLIVGVLISKTPGPTEFASASGQKVEYAKLRQGRLVADEYLTLENCLGGSGDENAVSLLSCDDKVYIFGNSNSSDYDLDGCDGRAFVMVLSDELSVIDIKFLGDGEKITSVCLIDGGFCVCFEDNGKIILRKYSFSLQLHNSVRADNGGSFFFENMRFDGNFLYLVLRQSVSPTRLRLVFYKYDATLSLSYERIISSPYSLDLIDYFVIGSDITLFMNCYSDLGFRPATAQINDSISVKITYLTDCSDTLCSSVIPTSDGFMLAFTNRDDVGVMVVNNDDFTTTRKKIIAKGTSATLYFGGEAYYFFLQGETNQAFALSSDLTTIRALEYLNNANKNYGCLSLSFGAIFIFNRNDKTVIAGSENSFLTTAPPCSSALICSSSDKYFICLTLRYNSPYAFGNNDILIYRLDL